MSKISLFILLMLAFQNSQAANYEVLSQDFLYSVRVNDDYQLMVDRLRNVKPEDLAASLNSEAKKKAFWLNIYNAFIQIKAKANPSMIKESRGEFFTTEWITIAGEALSFDDIEHGILRRSQWKFGMGYITAWFPSEFEKLFRMETVDYRIHFALNCGAAGCPPIAFYTSEKLEEQLAMASSSFLAMNTVYDSAVNTVSLSKILSWFKGDFGGEKGILNMLKKEELIPNDSMPKLTFKEYDWTLSLSNYLE